MRPDYEAKTEINAGHIIQFVIPKEYKVDIRIACLMELIANSLDAKPTVIEINFNYEKGILEVMDAGNGMSRESFRKEYHNITPSKTFGSGIGFAGQGAKLALNFCSKVVTETFSQSYKGYSEWRLEGEDAPYRIYDNRTLSLDHFGTKVTLYLDDKSITFYTLDLIEQTLKEHYSPLLDKELLRTYMGKLPILIEGKGASPVFSYRPIYEKGLKFFINSKQIIQQSL